MDISGSRQVVAGRAGTGVRTGHYVADGQVAMTLLRTQAGNGACWLGGRALFDDFPVGLVTAQPDGSDERPATDPPRPVSAYGDYAWLVRDARAIEPFPVKGQLSLFSVEHASLPPEPQTSLAL